MALAGGTSTRTHRLIGLAATSLLATVTALAFGRVFLGGGTTLRMAGAAIVAGGLAVAFERRSLLLATTVSAAGLAIAVGLIVFPKTLWYGIPTADTLRAALDAAAQVGEQARIQVAPAEPIAPLLLAAVVSLWAAVFSAHALAFRAGSPLLGLIPPVALVAFADTVLEELMKPLYGVAFLAAALLVVFADGLARVQGWGPVWSRSRRGLAASAGRGARRLAFTALGVAVVAPIVVPGFGSQAVVDFSTSARDRVAIDPFVSIQSSLSRQTPVEVLRVTAPRPAYIRLGSLPRFDGTLWGPDEGDEGVVVAPGDLISGAGPAIGTAETVIIDITTDVTTLGPNWLPTPYPMTSIDAPGRTVRFDAETGTTFIDEPLREGDRYTVVASLVRPTADELRNVLPAAPLENGRYLALPDDTPPEIPALARSWTADARNPFDTAMAIQDRLRDTSEFTYARDASRLGGIRSLLEFLTESKRGFCQQFSVAMAVMLRSIGIQARIVVGFASGTPTRRSGQYSITSDRLHSWVEVYFPGWGWMPFEPTPGRSNPVTAAYTAVDLVCPGPDCIETNPEVGGQTGTDVALGRSQRVTIGDDPRTGRTAPPIQTGLPTPEPQEPLIRARTALVIGALLGALVLLLMPPARALRRTVRLRRAAAEPRRFILVTHEQFTERASGMGLGRGRGETLEEYRRKVTGTGYLSDGHLDRLTRLATVAAYSPHEPDHEQAEEAGRAADVAIREIRRAVGPTRWLVGLYRRR
jgi:transglutaminase-like putative cysteine protease